MDSHPVMYTTYRRVIGVSTDQIATSAVFYKSHMVSTSQGALTRIYGTGSDFRRQNYNCLLELSAFILKKYCYNNTQILSEFFGYTKLGSHWVRISVSVPHGPFAHDGSEEVISIGRLYPSTMETVTSQQLR